MKHLSSLTALLVGLSLTTASYAQQAGGAKAKKKPTQTAVQGDDQPSGAAPAPAPAPEAAPAESPAPAAEPTPGVVTIGGTTNGPTGADAPTNDDKKKEEQKEERRWGGSAIIGYTAMSTSTIFRGQTQYADPTVDSSIWLMPRYNINEAFQVRGRIIFNYEWTNSDTTVTKNEPRFSDTTLQLVYKKIPEFAKIKPIAGIQVGLPTSPESRAKTMYFAPGVLGGLNRTFDKVGNGEISVGVSAIYSHPIYQGTNPQVRGERPYALQCASGGTDCSNDLGGGLNASDILAYSLSVGGKWGKWAPGVYALGASAFPYHPKSGSTIPLANNGAAGSQPQSVTVQEDPNFSRSSVRQTLYIAVSLDYEINDWITPEIGYSMYRNVLKENGTYGNPIYDPDQDMRVFVGVTIDPDMFINSLSGKKSEAPATHAGMKPPVFRY